MDKDVIIACDFKNAAQTLDFLDLFKEEKPFVKIGMELFYAEGPEIVRKIKKRGHRIFLDLKLHDIPNTVKKAMAVISDLEADLVNVHAAGGIRMMEAALEGLNSGNKKRPLIIAVTQLTSIDSEELKAQLLINEPMERVVMQYALNARTAGLDGVVCSPLEAKRVHEHCGEKFLTVTPGIRFSRDDAGDQRRVMTPEAARLEGSDYIVVGRPITRSEDPVTAYKKCREEFLGEI